MSMELQQVLPNHLQQRFTTAATLLGMLDPVRGPPIVHRIDLNPAGPWLYDNLQKKFLESFALICSTGGKGGETASAVCMEQADPSGTILRLCRNHGVPDELLRSLHILLADLQAIARTGVKSENKILEKIVVLDRAKINHLLEELRRPKIREEANLALSTLHGFDHSANDSDLEFREWIQKLPILITLPNTVQSPDLLPHIKWASKARWVYSEQIASLFSSTPGGVPKWMNKIYKLGRYYAATNAMIKFASKRSELFASIRVEPVEFPPPIVFSLADRKALANLLQRLDRNNHQQLMSKLSGRLKANRASFKTMVFDPEEYFVQSCHRKKHTVHAEMQLLAFYDHNPTLTPKFLFMGTSKKACYLCHQFITNHPMKMKISASHQKIYPSWMPAPCMASKVPNHKALLESIILKMETAALREIRQVTTSQRPANPDSTAGPSLTLLTYLLSVPREGDQETGGVRV